MFDVFFLSYDEPLANENFARLKSIVPNAKRVHGVKGIHAAHKMCASFATTERFFTVDADNWIVDGFDFATDFPLEDGAVYVWRCRNVVNGLVYGYGAIKLFPTAAVRAMPENSVDMTTSVSLHYRIVNVIGSETRFNTSEYEAWKSGFREAAKLASGVIHRQKDDETTARLDAWCSKGRKARYGGQCIAGALAGRAFGWANAGHPERLTWINDFDWLREQYDLGLQAEAEVQPSQAADNAAGVLRLMELVAPNPLVKNLRQAITRFPDANWNDALSWGQLQSKLWLIEELVKLDRDLGTVMVLGGWYGTLAALIFQDGRLRFDKIRSIDLDPACAAIADTLNRDPYVKDGWRFKASTDDMLKLEYDANCSYTTHRADGSPVALLEEPTTLINTSCDHIAPFEDWWSLIPAGKLVVLQNNNFLGADEDHVNTVETMDAFAAQSPMREVLFEGTLRLPEYTRFMRIGLR